MALPQFPTTIYLVRDKSGDLFWTVGITGVSDGQTLARYNLDNVYRKTVTTKHSLEPVRSDPK